MINNDLSISLRKRFNPDGSELRKMQLTILDILKYIDKICKENDIQYWLSSGTCLGAVRHGGFIPWDDDVDIEMLKPDYDRFIKIMRNDKNGRYVLQDHKTDPEYNLWFAKVRDIKSNYIEQSTWARWYRINGAFVDIFPIETSRSRLIFKICGALWVRTVIKCSQITNKWLRLKLIKFLTFTLSKIVFPPLRLINSNPDKGRLRHILGGIFSRPRYKTDISDTIRVIFEDSRFPIPKGYDHYLTSIYGNYSELPDLDHIEKHF